MAQNDSTVLGNVGTLLFIEWLVVKLDIWIERRYTGEMTRVEKTGLLRDREGKKLNRGGQI